MNLCQDPNATDIPLVSQMYGNEAEHLKSFHFHPFTLLYISAQSSWRLLGSPVYQCVQVGRDPSTHSQWDLFLGSLCIPIHDIWLSGICEVSACSSVCEFITTRSEPSASQADFAAFQFNALEENL